MLIPPKGLKIPKRVWKKYGMAHYWFNSNKTQILIIYYYYAIVQNWPDLLGVSKALPPRSPLVAVAVVGVGVALPSLANLSFISRMVVTNGKYRLAIIACWACNKQHIFHILFGLLHYGGKNGKKCWRTPPPFSIFLSDPPSLHTYFFNGTPSPIIVSDLPSPIL